MRRNGRTPPPRLLSDYLRRDHPQKERILASAPLLILLREPTRNPRPGRVRPAATPARIRRTSPA